MQRKVCGFDENDKKTYSCKVNLLGIGTVFYSN